MNILIDTREQGYKTMKDTRKERAQHYYTEKGHDAKITRLEYGDYLFDGKIIFEYKTIPDMLSSIRNKSLFDETTNQAKHYPYHYLIIVGDVKQYLSEHWGVYRRQWSNDYGGYFKQNVKMYAGAIRRVQTYSPVLQVKTESGAFSEMLLQASKCCEPNTYGTVRSVDGVGVVDVVLCSVGGVSTKRGERIKETLSVKCLDDLLGLSVEDLASVNGISGKTARNVYEFIHSS